MKNVLILAGGDIRKKLNFLRTKRTSPALIPINTRPLASYLIEFYRHYKDAKIYLIIDEDQKENVSKELIHYLRYFNLITVSHTRGVISTLKEALKKMPKSDEVIINLVTTIPLQYAKLGEVQISGNKTVADGWSSVLINDDNVEFLYKNRAKRQMGNAFAGLFSTKTTLLTKAIKQCNTETDLLLVVEKLHHFGKLKFKKTKWIDCGHEINYYKAKAKLVSSRSFNQIRVMQEKGVIRKSSSDGNALQAEEQFVFMLPKQLKIYFPRIINRCSNIAKKKSYAMEYYAYPTLAEYFLYWDLSCSNWQRIFNRLENILEEFAHYPYSIGEEAYMDFYLNKTISRVQLFHKQIKNFNQNDHWLQSKISINGLICQPFKDLLPKIKLKINDLYNEQDFCIMHGDFCFNNILYDNPSGIIRLIDARGSFGPKCVGIYGDRKYDLAKLAHSAMGYYDYFVNGLFVLQKKGLSFEYRIVAREIQKYVNQLCKKLIKNMRYSENDILFIVGLLFVSMSALHNDSIERQTTMYLHGIKLLNENLK